MALQLAKNWWDMTWRGGVAPSCGGFWGAGLLKPPPDEPSPGTWQATTAVAQRGEPPFVARRRDRAGVRQLPGLRQVRKRGALSQLGTLPRFWRPLYSRWERCHHSGAVQPG